MIGNNDSATKCDQRQSARQPGHQGSQTRITLLLILQNLFGRSHRLVDGIFHALQPIAGILLEVEDLQFCDGRISGIDLFALVHQGTRKPLEPLVLCLIQAVQGSTFFLCCLGFCFVDGFVKL